LWKRRLGGMYDSGEGQQSGEAWLKARSRVSDKKFEIQLYKSLPDWVSYINYTPGSFESAVDSLDKMIAAYGLKSKEVKDWLDAQDKVFSNFKNGSPSIPEPLPEGAPVYAKRERDYQIAAALFYDGQFDKAIEAFNKIAFDVDSRWSKLAPYLVARSYIRKATLGAKDLEKEQLQKAKDQIDSILNDKDRASIDQIARDLLQYVNVRLSPDACSIEIARRITDASNKKDFGSDLFDLTWIWDASGEAVPNLDSDLANWVFKFNDDGKDLDASLARFKESGTLAWLICALAQASNSAAKLSQGDKDALLAAGLKLDRSSPGYLSASYYASRVLIASGKDKEAKERIDQVLSKRKDLSPTVVNLFMDLKLALVDNICEFTAQLPRKIAGYDYSDYDIPQFFFAPDPANKKEKRPEDLLLEPMSAMVINQSLPFSEFFDLANKAVLPPPISKDFVQAAFVRAVILEKDQQALKLSMKLEQLTPELKPYLAAYRAATTAEKRKFEALYICLKFPGLRPYVTSGLMRQAKLAEIDSYRDNWWSEPESTRGVVGVPEKESIQKIAARFLDADKLKSGQSQRALILKQGPAPNYLASQLLACAPKQAQEPRLPEALYLAVR
ncbi:MAG: hypothetical protein K8F91_24985, partial [Candidatus Obscuribacterales bacterium]|nr:hypothetical protein [Candidatus Obscuribacterales bacterium]